MEDGGGEVSLDLVDIEPQRVQPAVGHLISAGFGAKKDSDERGQEPAGTTAEKLSDLEAFRALPFVVSKAKNGD